MSLRDKPSAQRVAEHPRATEYRLFADITRGLMAVGAAERSSEPFVSALERNRRLWTTLRADLESEGNWLAADLKAKLISLALWAERHTDLVLHEGAEVGPLIAVNRTIMEGLVN